MSPAPDRAPERDLMVDALQGYEQLLPARERHDRRVLEVMRAVPREQFVPVSQAPYAYENRPLPIGEGQTISQPLIVAMMTDLLDPEPSDKVLEVGTGSGYQAAVLARLVRHLYTIEIVPELAHQSAARLKALGYANVTVRAGDGYAGWPEQAPFDGIMVTAGAPHIPQPLVKQLKPGGRMVIPVGPQGSQQLMLVSKAADGKVSTRALMDVAFVPLTGRGRAD